MNKAIESDVLARRSLQVQRGAARAAVLDVNDGLVSVLCIVLAVAGAGADPRSVLLAGFAGLIAGAVSMAAGEWISVRAQVELFNGILADINNLIRHNRQMLIDQLADSLVKNGHSDKTAEKAAREIAKDDKHLREVYARQVMGFNPKELGSPWIAALSSFILFTVGALVPLSTWFFSHGLVAVWGSVILTGIGGLVVGGYISRTSGKSVVYGSLRQLFIIALASIVTYGVGYLFGVSVA